MKKNYSAVLKNGLLFLCCLFAFNIQKLVAQDQKDIAAIKEEVNKISAKIEVVLKTDMSLYNKMKSQLEAANAMKDETKRSAALSQYRTAFGPEYGRAIKKAGVDMTALIAELSKKFPDYEFRLNNDYSVEARPKRKANNQKPSSIQTNPVVKSITDFLQSREVHCGLVGFAGVDFETIGVKSWATGAVAGGCEANGTLDNKTNLDASAKSIALKLKAKLEINGFAVGVLGTSVCICNTSVVVDIVEPSKQMFEDSQFETVFAPVLWYGSLDDSKEINPSIDLTEFKGKQINIDLQAGVSAGSAICCATNGNSHVKLESATLSTTH
jgi:hypothetical protein